MADPIKYTISYSFSGWQASNPAKPLPAQHVDDQFAGIQTSIGQLVDAVKDVRRSDGKLKNASVTIDSLADEVKVPWTGGAIAAWAPVVDYAAGIAATPVAPATVVFYNGETYLCAAAHTTTALFETAKWTKLAAKGTSGSGTGDMVAANNLSDVADAAQARENIGAVNAADVSAAVSSALAPYSTTAQLTTILDGYTPRTRKLIAGAGITINGTTEATLGGDITIAAVSTDIGVPIGGYLFYPSTKTPTGRWIAGNGAAISRTTYTDLDTAMYVGDGANASEPAWYRCTDPANPSTSRSATGAYIVLPDLRGVAPRFLDDGRGLDPGRAVNSYQEDLIGSHAHDHSIGSVAGTVTIKALSPVINSVNANVPTASTGGRETRMKNIAVRGWIKF